MNDVYITEVGLLFISILLGTAAAQSGPRGMAFRTFFDSALDVTLLALRWVMMQVHVFLYRYTSL